MHQASIHAHHHIREASPAWALSRAEPPTFAESLDARTQRRQVVYGRDMDASTLAKVRVFVAELLQRKGISAGGFIGARAERGINEDEAPVLRPRGSMRYHFSSA